jgi:SAM-dependent methyltransferase
VTLLSPISGLALVQDTPHSLADGFTRFPVVDGIAFLRVGREALAAAALACLDRGDADGAAALLLADQDDWWRGPAADPDALRHLVRNRATLRLRDAMELLAWGPVGTYFAHRWSDPTYLAGLALMQAHWAMPASAFELACGIGHHLRRLGQEGVAVAGGDVVFAKLWVARHFVVPEARLVCFDAAHPWPMAGQRFDLVACHDAFYFLEPKPAIAAALRGLLSAGGTLVIGHVHNRDWPNLSAGAAVTAAELAALFPDALAYDDAELTRALVEARAPEPAAWADLGAVEAFSLAEGRTHGPHPLAGGLALPRPEATLVRNPLYGDDGRIAWPSERYQREYGPRATYPARATTHEPNEALVRRREFVDLPDRW